MWPVVVYDVTLNIHLYANSNIGGCSQPYVESDEILLARGIKEPFGLQYKLGPSATLMSISYGYINRFGY